MTAIAAENCLKKKMEIVQAIARNTVLQSRFIRTGDMRRLKRLIWERGNLLAEMAAVNLQLASLLLPPTQEIQSLVAIIAEKQQAVLQASDQALREAIFERDKIAAQLSNTRIMRYVKKRYVTQWVMAGCRSQLNLKG